MAENVKRYVCSFPRAAITNFRTLGDLKQQKFIFSYFWRPEVLTQVIGRLVFPPETLRENLYLLFYRFWWLQAFLDLWLHNFSICLHLLMILYSMSLSSLCLIRELVVGFRVYVDNPRCNPS